jgi:hypothetical protein
MSTMQVVLIIVIAIIVIGALAAGWMLMRRQNLRRRFGPEYDRVLTERGSRLEAEKELRARERRHAELDLRPLSEESRRRYVAEWEEVQARFLDAPQEAAYAGDELVTRLVAERGYPTGDFDEQLADLSVEHAHTLGQYREAHDIVERHGRGEASTEQLRQALVHYRALFSELVGEDATPAGESRLDRAGERSVDAADAPDAADESLAPADETLTPAGESQVPPGDGRVPTSDRQPRVTPNNEEEDHDALRR